MDPIYQIVNMLNGTWTRQHKEKYKILLFELEVRLNEYSKKHNKNHELEPLIMGYWEKLWTI